MGFYGHMRSIQIERGFLFSSANRFSNLVINFVQMCPVLKIHLVHIRTGMSPSRRGRAEARELILSGTVRKWNDVTGWGHCAVRAGGAPGHAAGQWGASHHRLGRPVGRGRP